VRHMLGLTRVPDPAVIEAMNQMDPDLAPRLESLRRGLTTPENLRTMIRGYEEVGVDQMVFQVQVGNTKHEHVCESLELFAREVMPEFAQRRPVQDAAKNERLEVAVKDALARIEPNTTDVSDYSVAADMGSIQYGKPTAPTNGG
jgi:hypothetical protein